MAEVTSSDFKKLIEAQQETTRQLMSVEERAADDAKKAEINQKRVEGGRKAWQTRQARSAEKANMADAADAEDANDQENRDSKMLGYLKSTAGFLNGIAQQGMQSVKSGLGGLSKFLMGGLAVAALAFLNNPKFEEIKNTIIDVVVPALAFLYDEIIKPIAEYIGGKLTNLFKDLKSYIDGEKGIGTVLMDNIGTVSAIVLALAVKTLGFGKLLTAIKGIGAALLWVGKGGPITLITSTATKIGAAFTALKTTLVTTVWPAITAKLAAIKGFFIAKLAAMKAFLVPLLPIIAIAAGIALVLYSLKKGFDDFMFELEATGSIWEAVKSGIVGVISNLFGFPLNLIKSGVSWILEKIGSIFGIKAFSDASKFLDKIDIIQELKDFFIMIGDTISGIWDGLLNAIQDILRSPKLKFLGGGFAADAIFGSPEQQTAKKKAKEEEQKQFELNRQALREKQKLEKEAAEAEKLAILKKKQEQIQPAISSKPILFKDTSEEDIANAQAKMARERKLRALRPTPEQEAKQAMSTIINAPNNVNAPTTTTLTTASTSIINTDRVTDKLSMVT